MRNQNLIIENIKPKLVCLTRKNCGETTCPCCEQETRAMFTYENGDVFTLERAIEMLKNSETFNESQRLLIATCIYAVEHCHPKIPTKCEVENERTD